MKEISTKIRMEIFYKGNSCLYWEVDRLEEWETFLRKDEEEILTLVKKEVDENCDADNGKDTPTDYGVIFWLTADGSDEVYELSRYGRTWL